MKFKYTIYGLLIWILTCSLDKDSEVFRQISLYVYLDEGNKLFQEDSLYKMLAHYQIVKLKCDGIPSFACEFYKISTRDNCKCFYYVAYVKQTLPRVYKLKGFRTSEFLYFFNRYLKYSLHSKKNDLTRYTQNKLRKYIFANIKVEDIDLRALFYHYYRNHKISKNRAFDTYSCYDKNYISAY